MSAAVLLAALLLAGCGGGAQKSVSVSKERAARALAGEEEHSIDMFPAVPAKGPGNAVIARVGSVAITAAAFSHLDEVLTPKIASYEPKSRSDCSYVHAPLEVRLSAKQKAAKLSAAQIKALCLRQHQALVKETTLQQLISNQWVINGAEELGLGVSEAEAKRGLAKNEAKLFKSKREFLQYIHSSGRTLADTLLAVRAQMATQRIHELIERKAQAKLDEAAIARYYQEHKKSFAIPGTRDIRAIRTWTRASILKAMAEVRAGKDIAGVAERVSIDRPSNKEGGLMRGVARGQEEAGLDQAIFAARPHVLIGPLHLRKRYYAFEVVKVTPGREKPLREVEGLAREKVAEELRAKEYTSFNTAFRKKWRARTSCAAGYVVSRCREFPRPGVLLGEDVFTVG